MLYVNAAKPFEGGNPEIIHGNTVDTFFTS